MILSFFSFKVEDIAFIIPPTTGYLSPRVEPKKSISC